ncbi:Dihydroorotate dehydrogenase (quinone) [Varanus komodoensis]|nr:Dihydroorotate dehydrogenase (quinone) [Varanus komodoensis]
MMYCHDKSMERSHQCEDALIWKTNSVEGAAELLKTRFGAWKMRVAVMEEQLEVSFTSHTEAQFSVLVCNRTGSSSCNSTGIRQSVSVGGLSSTSVNISGNICGANICIQGWRTDVDYSIPSYICDLPCTSSSWGQEQYEKSLSVLSIVALLLILITMMALLGHKLLPGTHLDHAVSCDSVLCISVLNLWGLPPNASSERTVEGGN